MMMSMGSCELSAEELSAVTGGGIVDNVASDAEATTAALLKRFAEASATLSTFIKPAQVPQPENLA
jgi:hypothetical protein